MKKVNVLNTVTVAINYGEIEYIQKELQILNGLWINIIGRE